MSRRPHDRGSPEFKVFVFGYDVTDYVSRINTNWTDDGRAPSTCEIALVNDLNRWVITPRNMMHIHSAASRAIVNKGVVEYQAPLLTRSAFGSFRSGVKPAVVFQPELPSVSQGISLDDATANVARDFVQNIAQVDLDNEAKNIIMGVKLAEFRTFDRNDANTQQELSHSTQSRELRDIRYLYKYIGVHPRYPVFAGAPVFHTGDPVRVFMRDPYTGLWYHKFCGFVADWDRSPDIDNKKVLTLYCEDVLRLLKLARTTNNAGVFQAPDTDMGQDFIFQNFSDSPVGNLGLTTAIDLMVFGAGVILPNQLRMLGIDLKDAKRLEFRFAGAYGAQSTVGRPFGVGAFNFSRSLEVALGGSPSSITEQLKKDQLNVQRFQLPLADLPRYQATMDNIVRPSDVVVLRNESSGEPFPTDVALMSQEAVIKEIGERPDKYPVDGGALYKVLPYSTVASSGIGNALREVIDRAVRSGIATQSAYLTRLGVIYEIAETIDFSFYATPRGDLILEMPFYDFDPYDIRSSGATPLPQIATATVGFQVPSISDDDRRRVVRAAADSYTYLIDPSMGLTALALERVPALALDIPVVQGTREHVLDTALRGLSESRVPIADPLPFQNLGGLLSSLVVSTEPYMVRRDEFTAAPTQHFTDENIKTHIRAGFSITQGTTDTGESPLLELYIHRIAYDLVAAHGLRFEESKPWVYIATEAGAAYMADVVLNKSQAEALTSTLPIKPRMSLGPNRPIEVFHEDGNYIATIRSVSHIIDPDGLDSSMTLGVNYTRVWEGGTELARSPESQQLRSEAFEEIAGIALPAGRVPIYRPIASARPLNFLQDMIELGASNGSRNPGRGDL